MRNKEERTAWLKENNMSLCAEENMCKAFGVTDEFKASVEEDAVGMMKEYAEGESSAAEFTLSMLALGESEGEKAWMVWKATTHMNDSDAQTDAFFAKLLRV